MATRSEVEDDRKPEPVDAFSIATFCERHDISIAHYYRLRAEGLTPAEMRVGGRILISRESAQKWRRARTAPATIP
jgi:hypothetical protein